MEILELFLTSLFPFVNSTSVITLIFLPNPAAFIWSLLFQISPQAWSSRLSFFKPASLTVSPLPTNVLVVIAVEVKKPGPDAPPPHGWGLYSVFAWEKRGGLPSILFFSNTPKVTFNMVDGGAWGEPWYQFLCPARSLLIAACRTPMFGRISTVTRNRKWVQESAKMGESKLTRAGWVIEEKALFPVCPSVHQEVCWAWEICWTHCVGLHPSGGTSYPSWPLLYCNHEINLRHRKIIRLFCTKHLKLVAVVWTCMGTPAAGTWGHWGLGEVTATPVQRVDEWLNYDAVLPAGRRGLDAFFPWHII